MPIKIQKITLKRGHFRGVALAFNFELFSLGLFWTKRIFSI